MTFWVRVWMRVWVIVTVAVGDGFERIVTHTHTGLLLFKMIDERYYWMKSHDKQL